MGNPLDFIGDTVDSVFDAVGDAFEWVGDRISEAWENDLVKVVAIVAVAYFAFFMLPEMMAATSVETAVAAETGILSAGATDLTLASSGMQLGSSAAAEGALATTAEIAGTATTSSTIAGAEAAMGSGALGAISEPAVINTLASDGRLAAGIEGVGGAGAPPPTLAGPAGGDIAGTSGVDLTMAGGSGQGMTVGSADPGVLSNVSSWASENPMLAYGGMMTGGQALAGYMQGKSAEEIEQQRLAEEAAARNRQNVWGVNYAEGGEAISAGDRLKDLNRAYFDSSAPINPAVQDYQLASVRASQGAYADATSRANPDKYANRQSGAA